MEDYIGADAIMAFTMYTKLRHCELKMSACQKTKKQKKLNDFLLLAHESFLIRTNQFNVLQRYTALHE